MGSFGSNRAGTPVPASHGARGSNRALNLHLKSDTVNPGAATLSINGHGAKAVNKNDKPDLADGGIVPGQAVTVQDSHPPDNAVGGASKPAPAVTKRRQKKAADDGLQADN